MFETISPEYITSYNHMKKFEDVLTALCKQLGSEALVEKFLFSNQFELRVREVLAVLTSDWDMDIDFNPHPHIFPDIVLGSLGVEVKFTEKNTWRSVANSVF